MEVAQSSCSVNTCKEQNYGICNETDSLEYGRPQNLHHSILISTQKQGTEQRWGPQPLVTISPNAKSFWSSSHESKTLCSCLRLFCSSHTHIGVKKICGERSFYWWQLSSCNMNQTAFVFVSAFIVQVESRAVFSTWPELKLTEMKSWHSVGPQHLTKTSLQWHMIIKFPSVFHWNSKPGPNRVIAP